MVGSFGAPNSPTSFMTAPENIFRTFKVRVPHITTLTPLREWASGNNNELFTQDINHAEVEVGKITPIPFEWANYFLEKYMTPSASLTFVQQVLNETIITNTVAFDPLLNWLRAASCKEKGNQCSPTDTPTTTYWLPSFPNKEVTRWVSIRMNNIFSTTQLKTTSTLSEGPHRTHPTITDNDMQAEMISQAVAATLITVGLASPNSTAHVTTSVPLSSTKDKLMGKTRRIRTKGWCGLHDGIPVGSLLFEKSSS